MVTDNRYGRDDSGVRRLGVLSALAAVLICGCPDTVHIKVVDRHGNTPNEATDTPSHPVEDQLSGYLTKGDRDYFRIAIAGLTYLRARTVGGTDTFGILHDHVGRAIAADDDSGRGRNFDLGHRLGPGVYYLQVTGASPRAEGPYTLRVDFAEFDEHGSSRTTATYVALDTAIHGFMQYGDTDYFKTVVDRDGTLLRVSSSGGTDTEVYLEDAFGRVLGYDDDGGAGRNFSLAGLVSAGTYYVRIEGYGVTATGRYLLHVESL